MNKLLSLFILIFATSVNAAIFTVTRSDDRNDVCIPGVDCSLRAGFLRGGFNPFNNGQIKLSPDDFTASGELDRNSLAPEVQVCSNLSFAATNFSVNLNPYSVTTGDFNGDGKLDLATANPNSNNVSVLLGSGTGGFSAAISFSVGTRPFSVTTGDFNGDGKLDLATANYESNNVSVLLGNGTGGFIAAISFSAGTSPFSVTAGDFNGDGKLDLATANPPQTTSRCCSAAARAASSRQLTSVPALLLVQSQQEILTTTANLIW